MFAIGAIVAFAVGLILRLTDAGSGHAADPWVWSFVGWMLLTAHLITPVTPWRRA